MGRSQSRGRNRGGRGRRGGRGGGPPRERRERAQDANPLQPAIDYAGLPRDDDDATTLTGGLAPELLLPMSPAPPAAAASGSPENGPARVQTEAGSPQRPGDPARPRTGRAAPVFDAIDGVVDDAPALAEETEPAPQRGRGRGRRFGRPRPGEEEHRPGAPTSGATASGSPYAPSAPPPPRAPQPMPGTPAPGGFAPTHGNFAPAQGGGFPQHASPAPAPPLPPPPPLPTSVPASLMKSGVLQISKLERMPLPDLLKESAKDGLEELGSLQKRDVISQIVRARLRKHAIMFVEGCLEILPEGFGFVRSQVHDYLPIPDDVYVSPSLIRKFGLKTGHMLAGAVRAPREGEKYLALARIDSVNGEDTQKLLGKPAFEELTPLYPEKRLVLETKAEEIETRLIDLIAPIGKGQRGLIVSPPRAGKTVLLQKIANSITKNDPDVTLIVLLVDERPEEVTDMERSIRGEVIASTFDEP